MLRHYLVMAARGLMRHKLYSLMNIAGLGLGLACVIFVMLFVRYETSFDKWVPDSARVYRLEVTAKLPGRSTLRTALTPFPWAGAMRQGIPGVRAATRLRTREVPLWVGNRRFLEPVDVVEPNFFQVIRLPLLEGDSARVFSQPESLVLSERTAAKFFGHSDPVGRTVSIRWTLCAHANTGCRNVSFDLKVTGVMRNLPRDSQLTASVVAPDTSIMKWSRHDEQEWLSANWYSYVVLGPGVDPRSVIAHFRPIEDRGAGPQLAKRNMAGPASRLFQPQLTPFVDVHLDSAGYVENMTPPGSRVTVYGAAVIGLLVLLVACFNFMNLTTARAGLRAREIALRKCAGANRKELAIQFLGESMAIVLCALVLALAVVETLMPAFDGLLDRPIVFHYFSDWRTFLAILGVAAGAGLISGSYPALVLSGFRPGAALRTSVSAQVGSGRLRTALVVLQFAVSIGLAVGVIVISRQMNFARRMELGFDPNHVVVMNTWGLPSTRDFIDALERYPGVRGAAVSDTVPFSSGHPLWLAKLPGQPDSITVRKIGIGPDFPRVYHIRLVAGRLLAADRGEDTLTSFITPENAGHNILVNAAAARRFGYTPAQAVGKTIVLNNSPVNIVGVLGNARVFGTLGRVRPTVFFNDPIHEDKLSIRIAGRDIPTTLRFIDRTWQKFAPLFPSERYFLTSRYATYYGTYRRQSLMLEIFVAAAIVIACLGLFGLSVFTAEGRTKEIGIRKVTGARTYDLVKLMLWRISVPMLAANVVAWPIAFWLLRQWLDEFAYHIPLGPLYFVAGGAAALLIGWTTVFWHSLQLARTQPVRALRYE